jgi:23S rRNA (cytidine2498-2'-O)-methyltransferase
MRNRANVPEAGDLYLGPPAHADVLAAELRALGAKSALEAAPGAVVVEQRGLLDPCFARQVLPAACIVRAANVNELAGALLDAAGASSPSLDPADVAITLPEMPRRGSHALDEHPLTSARVELARIVEAKILGRRAKRADLDGSATVTSSSVVVSALLVDAWRAWVSVHARPAGPALLAWPSRFVGGRALDEAPKDAPSSAHRKLDEALAWLESSPGPDDVVLDLGAAPGGWSSVALAKGARVYAVDRADLDPHVASHANLVHVRKDAFKYVPERMPSWLLCDVIAEPQRSLDVAKRALESKALAALVVTLKLRNPVELAVLDAARALCKRTQGFFGRAKNLAANKLEVTLMMKRA